MSDINAKMHQHRFPLGPLPLAGFEGPTSVGKKGREKRKGEGKGGERRGKDTPSRIEKVKR